MKQLAVIFTLCLLVSVKAKSLSFTITENDTSIYENCIKASGFSEEELEVALKNYDKNADKMVQCFNGCLYDGYQIIKQDGSIDLDAAVKFYGVEKMDSDRDIVAECSKQTGGKDHCEIAQSMESCFHTRKQRH